MYESGYQSVIRLTRTSRKTELVPSTAQAGLTTISAAGTQRRDTDAAVTEAGDEETDRERERGREAVDRWIGSGSLRVVPGRRGADNAIAGDAKSTECGRV